ncbi:MAG: arsenite methyltransferase [Coriobacteriia bacterium]
MDEQRIRKAVRERYAEHATQGSSCCPPSSCGCGPVPETISRELGYSDEQLASVPEGADLGLGCGNPTALVELSEGEVVLDLGSGAGIDCFLAAKRVGDSGRVIGVDMTPEMLERARANAREGGFDNVEFRLGEIEHLPVADSSVDAVISNCVINLSPDKPQVFREAFRVLRPGGRMTVSDIVLDGPLPKPVLDSLDAYSSCISGAALRSEYLAAIEAAGFEQVEVVAERQFDVTQDLFALDLLREAVKAGVTPDEARNAAASVRSITVRAFKPR